MEESVQVRNPQKGRDKIMVIKNIIEGFYG